MFSVGEILKKERIARDLSLSDVEKEIKIREKFLAAIEQNNWSFFSSRIYIMGVIKNYALFLGLDSKKILAFFRRDYEKKEDIRFKKRVASSYLIPETRRVVKILFVGLFLILFFYFGYQLKVYFSPPAVTILSPKNERILREDKVTITGKTEKESLISIFGERVFQNKDGVFTYDFPLKEGTNELIIEVVGANGKKTVLKKNFFLEK